MSLPIFERLYFDIVERGGIHTIGTKQTGKSNLKKSETAYVIQNHPETKTVVIDPSGTWEFDFSKVRFYRIPKKSMQIIEEPIGVRLNGQVFTRKAYKLDPVTQKDILSLLKDSEPVLFIVELENPEEIGYFSAYVIETVYNMQRIARKYHRGDLPKSYFIVLEEAENIFDQSSLDKTIFNKLRKKYAEMANLRIGVLSSSQRLTEVSKKFRAKMSGYLIGHILEDDYVGLIQRMLKIKLGKKAKIVTDPNFRYKFFCTALNRVLEPDKFKPDGKPYEITRGFSMPKPQPQPPKQKPKRSILTRIKELINLLSWGTAEKPNFNQQPQAQEPEDENETEEELGEEHTLLAENEDEETETYYM